MVDLGVFIGRFQPFHRGHLFSVLQALESCQRLLIVIGSIHRARNVRNPFTFEERVQMLRDNFLHYDGEHGTNINDRIIIEGVRDYLYNDTPWVNDIKTLVNEHRTEHDSVSIVGFDKDHSTYYLSIFPDFGRIPIENYQDLNATPMRHQYFEHELHEQDPLPDATQQFLAQFKFHEEYERLKAEYLFIQSYKSSWAETPYPPIFVTTDAVVICQHKILLVKRKFQPGKGLWALPGGFIEVNERVEAGLLRELREETQIDVDDETLKQSIKEIRTFDHPERSQIGRVITHAGLIELTESTLPAITAADDALEVMWYPLDQLDNIADQLHDDHFQIIQHQRQR